MRHTNTESGNRFRPLAMAGLSAIALALALGTIPSIVRAERVSELATYDQCPDTNQKCCESGGGISRDDGVLGKCVARPPDSAPPGSQHDLSDIGSETLTPSPLRTHDLSDIGSETFTPEPVSTPQPSPPAPPSTTWVPNPCLLPDYAPCAEN